ncbi:MAG: hypothetical protein M1814_004170 [Vezdaea aestivalis]|nr:MAG: hypothetical protein M1814_004170 [Vezdaea aestivalis]
MDGAQGAMPTQMPVDIRQLQPSALQSMHPPHTHSALTSRLSSGLQTIDHNQHAFNQQMQADLQGAANRRLVSSQMNGFAHPAPDQPTAQPHTPHRPTQPNGQYGMLTPSPSLTLSTRYPQDVGRVAQLHHEQSRSATADTRGKGDGPLGHFDGMKKIADPPNLDEWRQKLFDVTDTLTLTEDEFRTYFPHVDNVYSHRSTQKYKRKPFISHYWDCRLKGRPPGTPKSDDPTKKKRKRTARERDLCEVKIKITEYFPGAVVGADYDSPMPPPPAPNGAQPYFSPGQSQQSPLVPQSQLGTQNGAMGQIVQTGPKCYTIQRVNGNGQNGKGDGVVSPHRHSLDESDKIKKNSVVRSLLKEEKERKKTQKSYHKKATGAALATVKKHSRDNIMKLYGSCFCPFVQRVWIALEAKGVSYQYIEVDPYKKPDSLLQVNPKGLVPAMRLGDACVFDSMPLIQYLEDVDASRSLLPPDPFQKWHSRYWANHVNDRIVPFFYKTLQAQKTEAQISNAEQLRTEIAKAVDACDPTGPFFLGPVLSLVDVVFAPWMLRLSRVLKPYRGWPDPEIGSRWGAWVNAIESNEHVRATTSTDDLYLDSYERYAGGLRFPG